MFGEGINNLPYDNFVASHSAITNVIHLSKNCSNFCAIYPPVKASLICNLSESIIEVSTDSIEPITTDYISISTNQELFNLETRIKVSYKIK